MSSYLSRVTDKSQRKPKKPRIVIQGALGLGKTWFAASALGVALIPFEEGEGILEVKVFPKPESYADAMNMLAELASEKHPYKTLVIDTIDHLEPLVWDAVCEGTKHDHIEGFGYGKGYTMADPLWIAWFRSLDVLREQGMTIIILSHNEMKTVDDPNVGAYTRTVPKLHKRACALMCEWADIVGLLDIERVAKDVGKAGGRETRTSRTTGQRILFLEDGGGFVAKNRYDLPTQILIPKVEPFSALRAELLKALGLDKPKTAKKAATTPKEAA